MKKLTSLLLFLFTLTAFLTVADGLQRPFLHLSAISFLNQIAWLISLLTGALLYIGLGIDRRLPKIILLPLFFWMAWSLLNYWPLDRHWYPYIAVAQLTLVLVLLLLNKSLQRKNRLQSLGLKAKPPFSGRRFIYFCLISIPVVPFALLLGSYSFVAHLIDVNTAGFVQLKPNGLYLTERIYQRDNKNVRLTGMIHLADEDFYTGLINSLNNSHTLILAEGVGDKKGLLKREFSYGKIADFLGLESQEKVAFPVRLIKSFETAETNGHTTPDILRADIDVSQFNPRTIEVLSALAKYVLNGDSMVEGYVQFNNWAQDNVGDDINGIVMDDLIEKRNRSVVSFIEPALKKYKTVVIPWGALHMKGIETMIKEQGFRKVGSQQRLSIDFQKLPYHQLWDSLTNPKDNTADEQKN